MEMRHRPAAALSIQGVDCGLKGTADPPALRPHSAVRPVHGAQWSTCARDTDSDAEITADFAREHRAVHLRREQRERERERGREESRRNAPRPLLASALIGCV